MCWLLVVLGVALGASIGSFLGVVVSRVPKGQSIVSPPSRCESCARQLTAVDNIPLVSWLVLRGRCRTCGATIPARYFLIELAGAVVGGAIGALLCSVI
jgi:leader peptidase (prepilin peptidase) / N-methyltransferase